jgi:hypothetical protein
MDPIALRVAGLWGAWLLVMLFHVELGLMPLFHGVSVEIKSRVSTQRLPSVFLAMMCYFLLPVLAMILAIHAASDPSSWTGQRPWRGIQLVLSLVYSLTNVGHLVADIIIPDSRVDQVVLMALLVLIGLLLNFELWSWWRA